MIEHIAPFVKVEGRRLDGDGLRFHSRGYRPALPETVSGRIVGHYDAIIASLPGKLDNSMRGWLFEVIVYDALVHFGIPPSRIRDHQQVVKGRKAEIDLLVSNGERRIGIMLKTSLRERGVAQFDRTGLICQYQAVSTDFPTDLWGLFLREHRDDTAARMMAYARRQHRAFASKARLHTVLDEQAMRELLAVCGATGYCASPEDHR